MADTLSDGRITVWSVPSIANIAAPTASEINAGMRLDIYMTPDGLVGFAPDTAEVPSGKLSSTYDTKLPGRVSLSGTLLRFYMQTGTDTVYNTLVYGYATNIVIRKGVLAGATVATGQRLIVAPGTCGEVKPVDVAPNELEKYEVPFMVSPQPTFRSAVA